MENCYFASVGFFPAFVQPDKASVQTDKAVSAMFCAKSAYTSFVSNHWASNWVKQIERERFRYFRCEENNAPAGKEGQGPVVTLGGPVPRVLLAPIPVSP